MTLSFAFFTVLWLAHPLPPAAQESRPASSASDFPMRGSPLLAVEFLRDLPPETEPSVSSERAREWAAEMRPAVEAAAGRRFSPAPEVRLVKRQEAAAALAPLFLLAIDAASRATLGAASRATLDATGRESDDATRQPRARDAAELVAAASLAHRDPADGGVLLLAGNIGPLLDRVGVSAGQRNSVIRIALLHELVHVLQDQQVDPRRQMADAQDEGHVWTIRQLREAHAVLVTRRAATALGLDAALGEFDKLAPGVATPETLDAYQRREPRARVMLEHHHLAHRGAETALARHFETADADAVWSLLADPPRMVFRDPRQSQAAVVMGLDRLLGARWDDVESAAGPPALAATFFGPLDAADRAQIGQKLAHVQTLVCKTKINERVSAVGSVTLHVLNDPAFAATLTQHVFEVLNRTATEGPMASRGTAKLSPKRELALTDGRTATTQQLTVDLPRGGKFVQTIGCAASGQYVVQVMGVHFVPSDAAMIGVMNELLARVARLEQQRSAAATQPVQRP